MSRLQVAKRVNRSPNITKKILISLEPAKTKAHENLLIIPKRYKKHACKQAEYLLRCLGKNAARKRYYKPDLKNSSKERIYGIEFHRDCGCVSCGDPLWLQSGKIKGKFGDLDQFKRMTKEQALQKYIFKCNPCKHGLRNKIKKRKKGNQKTSKIAPQKNVGRKVKLYNTCEIGFKNILKLVSKIY